MQTPGGAFAVVGWNAALGEADPHQPEVVVADDVEADERALGIGGYRPAEDAVRRAGVAGGGSPIAPRRRSRPAARAPLDHLVRTGLFRGVV